jgi:hypothetical protein
MLYDLNLICVPRTRNPIQAFCQPEMLATALQHRP